jgi:hypothetical protein
MERNIHFWVEKFDNGEFLREWNGFDPFYLGPMCDNLNIGEEKYIHCTGSYYGIGDVEWWIKEELDKLNDDEKKELLLICQYKKYLRDKISYDFKIVNKLTEIFGCESFHIHRTGDLNILNLCNQLYKFTKLITKHSKGCCDPKTIEFNKKDFIFRILSFKEFKKININNKKVKTI